jgi:hypothetical protein
MRATVRAALVVMVWLVLGAAGWLGIIAAAIALHRLAVAW